MIDELLAWADEQRGDEPRDRYLARVLIHAMKTLDATIEGFSPGFARLDMRRATLPPKPHHRSVDE